MAGCPASKSEGRPLLTEGPSRPRLRHSAGVAESNRSAGFRRESGLDLCLGIEWPKTNWPKPPLRPLPGFNFQTFVTCVFFKKMLFLRTFLPPTVPKPGPPVLCGAARQARGMRPAVVPSCQHGHLLGACGRAKPVQVRQHCHGPRRAARPAT